MGFKNWVTSGHIGHLNVFADNLSNKFAIRVDKT